MNAHTITPALNPPAHIVGKMHCKTPAHIMDQRAAWIADHHRAGFTYPEIAAALGIERTAARKSANRAGYRIYAENKDLTVADMAKKVGLKLGNIGPQVDALPPGQRERLIDLAIKHRCDVAGALVKHFAEGAR